MLRYGLPRILILILFGAALVVLTLMMLGIRTLTTGVLLSFAAVVLGLNGIDLALTGRRVLSDFRKGRFADAQRGTRWLLRFAFKPRSRATLQLNLAACHLAAAEPDQAGDILKRLDRDALSDAVLGVWENNYAYYLLSTGGPPEEALSLCNDATRRNPSNPAFRSTRGIAHLALGYVDDAIAELQVAVDAGLRAQGPAAMAENYYHMARAWETRGEIAYSRDHYLKSVNIGPDTLFGRKSAVKLKLQHGLWPAD